MIKISKLPRKKKKLAKKAIIFIKGTKFNDGEIILFDMNNAKLLKKITIFD